MLLFIYFCALILIGISADMEKRRIKFPPNEAALTRAAFLKCGEEYGIPPSTLNRIKEGYYSEDNVFKNYMFCVYQKTGYAKPNGHIDISKVVTLFPKDVNILPIFENCDIQGADSVETAFLSFKCYQETTPVWLAI